MSTTPAMSRLRSLRARPTLLGAGDVRRAGAFFSPDVRRAGVVRLADVFERDACDGRVREGVATVATTLTGAPGTTGDAAQTVGAPLLHCPAVQRGDSGVRPVVPLF